MAQAKRNDIDPHGHSTSWQSPEQVDRRYPAGSPIAQLQADLARRLRDDSARDERLHATSPGDRIVHLISMASGFVGLAAGYAIAGAGIVYWLRG